MKNVDSLIGQFDFDSNWVWWETKLVSMGHFNGRNWDGHDSICGKQNHWFWVFDNFTFESGPFWPKAAKHLLRVLCGPHLIRTHLSSGFIPNKASIQMMQVCLLVEKENISEVARSFEIWIPKATFQSVLVTKLRFWPSGENGGSQAVVYRCFPLNSKK